MSAASAEAAAKVTDDNDSAASRNYAEAFLNVAGSGEGVESALGDLESIQDEVFVPHPELARLLTEPGVGMAAKDGVLTRTLEGRVGPTVLKFLRVLNRRGRLDQLGAITRQARARWDRQQGRRPVTVRSASALDEAQLAALRERLAAFIGGTPVLRLEVDPGLIGGLVIQVGDYVYDASVRSRLQQIRRRIVESKSAEASARRDLFEA